MNIENVDLKHYHLSAVKLSFYKKAIWLETLVKFKWKKKEN